MSAASPPYGLATTAPAAPTVPPANVGGSGTMKLLYRYKVKSTDADTDRHLRGHQLAGTGRPTAAKSWTARADPVTLTHSELADDSDHKVGGSTLELQLRPVHGRDGGEPHRAQIRLRCWARSTTQQARPVCCPTARFTWAGTTWWWRFSSGTTRTWRYCWTGRRARSCVAAGTLHVADADD